MPELEIIIGADVSDLLSKLDAAAAAVRSNVGTISENFQQAGEQASLFGDAVTENVGQVSAEVGYIDALKTKLEQAALAFAAAAAESDKLQGRAVGATGGQAEADAYAEATTAEVQAAQNLTNVQEEVKAALQGVIPQFVEAAAAEQRLTEATNAVALAQQQVTATLNELAAATEAYNAEDSSRNWIRLSLAQNDAGVASDALTQAQAALAQATAESGNAAGRAAQQYELFADAASKVTIADAVGPLEEANGQFLLFSEAAEDATGQASLFERATIGTAEANKVAAESAAQYAINAKALTEALNFLNDAQAVSQASAEEIALAQKTVRDEAARVAAAAGAAAISEKGLAAATTEATRAQEGQNTRLAGAVASMGAVDAGAGRLAFTFRLLAGSLPGLSAAITALFYPVLIYTFIDLISSAADKFTKLGDNIRKAGEEWDDLAASEVRGAEATELQNLKLEDTLAKLEGRPTSNRMKQAALETAEAFQQLSIEAGKAIEKIIEDFESKGVTVAQSFISVIRSAFTDEAVKPWTGPDFDEVKPKFEDLALAIRQQNQANTELALNDTEVTRKAKENADQRVQDIINGTAKSKGVLQELKDLQDEVNKRPSEQVTTYYDQYGGPHTSKVKQDFTEEKIDIADTITWLEAYLRKQKDVQDAAAIKPKVATAADAEEAYNRRAALELDAAKNKEKVDAAVAATDKATAESRLKATEAIIKEQVAATQTGGKERAQAELDSIPLLIAAQEKKNEAELAAFDKGLTAKKLALAAERTTYETDTNEERRKKELADNDAAYTELLLTETDKRANIERDGLVALLNIDREADNKRIEAAKVAAQRLANVLREAEKGAVGTANLELRGINEQVRAEERRFALGAVNRSQEKEFLAQKLAQLKQEQAIAEANIQAQIEREVAAQKPGGAFAPIGKSPEIEANTQTILKNIAALDANTAAIKAAIIPPTTTKPEAAHGAGTAALTGKAAEVAIPEPIAPPNTDVEAIVKSVSDAVPTIVSDLVPELEASVSAAAPAATTATAAPVTSIEGTNTALIASQDRVENLQRQLDALRERWQASADAIQGSLDKLDTSASAYFTRMKNESNDFMTSFQIGWQQSLNTFNNGFADAVDKWISYGNNFRESFGRNMANLGVKILEQFTNIFLQIGLKQAEVGVAKLVGIDTNKFAGAANPAQAANTAQLTTATASLTAFTAAVNAATVAQSGQVPAVTASTTAHATHAPTVHTSTLAHLGHIPAVIGSTIAHIAHAIATDIDTVATKVAAAIKIAFAWIGLATGGQVPGTGSSDTVPAMLTPGEFVITKSAASSPGAIEFLHKLNRGEAHVRAGAGIGKAFAEGGIVGPAYPYTHFALGGAVGKPEYGVHTSTSNSNVTHNRFMFNQTIHGGQMSPEEIGQVAFEHIKNKLRRSGYNI